MSEDETLKQVREALKSLSAETQLEHEVCHHIFGYLTNRISDPNMQVDMLLKILTFVILSSTDPSDEITYEQTYNQLINRLIHMKQVSLNFQILRKRFGTDGLARGLATIVKSMAESGKPL